VFSLAVLRDRRDSLRGRVSPDLVRRPYCRSAESHELGRLWSKYDVGVLVMLTEKREQDRLDEIVARLGDLQESMKEINEKLAGTMKNFFTVEEFGNHTGRAPYTVRSYIKAGLIKAERIAGTGPKGRLLIPRSELAKLIALGRGEKITNAILVNDGEPSKKTYANTRHTGSNRPLTVVPASNKLLD
jgi:hypothetical protein